MSCHFCKSKLKYYENDLCTKCKYDSDIVISFSEVKRKYKLTDEDIGNGNLLCIEFLMYNTYCRKYLIDDIEKLACELTENLDINDKRKRAYIKQKNIRDELKRKKQNKEQKMEEIKEYVEISSQKHDIKIGIDDSIQEMLDKYSESDNISVTYASLKIILYMEQKIKIIKKQNIRKEEINNFIKNKYGTEYIKPILKIAPYKKYMNHSINKDDCFNEIDKHIQTIISKKKRKNKLNKLLTKDFNKKYLKLAQNHYLYGEYINGDDKCSSQLIKIITNTKLQQSRKSKIDYRIRKYIDKEYRDSIRKEAIYNNFIQTGDKPVDKVIEMLIKKAEKFDERNKREKVLYEMIEKEYDMDYWDYAKQLKVCNKYINHNIGDINDIINVIDSYVKSCVIKRGRGLRNSKADRFLNLCKHNISYTVSKSNLYKEYVNQYTKKYTLKDFIRKVEKMYNKQNVYTKSNRWMYFNDNLKDNETSTEKIDDLYTNYEQWCENMDKISVYKFELLEYLKDMGYI